MKVEPLAAVILTGLLLSGCATNPIPGQYFLYGQGSYSCDTWATSRGTALQEPFDSWLVGFVSGVGYINQESNPMYHTNLADMSAWIDAYCRDYPYQHMAEAAAKMVEAMQIP